jgi:hypothetical protein
VLWKRCCIEMALSGDATVMRAPSGLAGRGGHRASAAARQGRPARHGLLHALPQVTMSATAPASSSTAQATVR